jgi:hypothetical protein
MRRKRQGDIMNGMRSLGVLATALVLLVFDASPVAALEFPGPSPGTARAELANGRLVIENDAIRGVWNLSRGQLGLMEVVDRLSDQTYALVQQEVFVVELADGRMLRASQFESVGEPVLERLAAEPQSVRRGEHSPGWKAAVAFRSTSETLQVRWEILLRDQSNYLQQRLVLQSAKPLQVREVTLLDARLPSAVVCGEVLGSPLTAGNLFLACEHPMANNRVEGDRIVCEVPRYRDMARGESWTVSSVVGVVPEGQLRRGFLYYLERERVRPYSPYVYYISWFDIAYKGRRMTEKECLDRIASFGRELTQKRDVKLDAFVFDDGWDDPQTLWQFHTGFPTGFMPLQVAAAKHNAVLGTWISPWGGYSEWKAQRLEFGKKQGFETNGSGFSLAGPKYYERFHDVCLEHLRSYGVRYFKFDGIGTGTSALRDGKYAPDMEALLRLIDDIRHEEPGVFINVTAGTWPSPYWLWYSDSVWRDGYDTAHSGAGSGRQQWITYRDTAAYHKRVLIAPLYPLNSLKFQSVVNAPLGIAAKITGSEADLADDIRMAAGSGTQLQEFFVTPNRMSSEAWDTVAEAIAWMRENTDVLVDSHWIGGDPGKGEIYGYASWAPRKGIIVLRNPSDKLAEIRGNLQSVFELPEGSPGRYRIRPLWQKTLRDDVTVDIEQTQALQLAPFEMVVLEALPISEQ